MRIEGVFDGADQVHPGFADFIAGAVDLAGEDARLTGNGPQRVNDGLVTSSFLI
jgi:hypothetical protein